jgi:hypothetical protein
MITESAGAAPWSGSSPAARPDERGYGDEGDMEIRFLIVSKGLLFFSSPYLPISLIPISPFMGGCGQRGRGKGKIHMLDKAGHG